MFHDVWYTLYWVLGTWYTNIRLTSILNRYKEKYRWMTNASAPMYTWCYGLHWNMEDDETQKEREIYRPKCNVKPTCKRPNTHERVWWKHIIQRERIVVLHAFVFLSLVLLRILCCLLLLLLLLLMLPYDRLIVSSNSAIWHDCLSCECVSESSIKYHFG